MQKESHVWTYYISLLTLKLISKVYNSDIVRQDRIIVEVRIRGQKIVAQIYSYLTWLLVYMTKR